ncbi:MAG TPA: phenylalanine--tRNA ligase subunit beta [Anaerolineales bacterium]|nr:phenylalanine--tRNA ligase subunit beta [Anaerolineales bacterium]
MKLPISWLKDYIDLDGLSIEEIAKKLTLAGLEVDEIKYAGLPMPAKNGERHEFKTSGIGWDRDKIVVAEIREVNPHPNADRLTLLDLFDGQRSQVVLTGAPNIFHLKGTGKLAKPIKVAYAKEGSTIYDGHADGLVLTTLKRAKIRGVESYSMVASEKELGISEEHEGIIILDDDAPVGMPLVDYMGDAVLDISILPNMARNANVIGIARELSALTGRPLRKPTIEYPTEGQPVQELVAIEINEPELNPRFVIGLIRDVEIKPSPYQIQRRLRLAGVRPINNIVDATNYAMIDLGEPLHAFDYDVLKERAGNKNVKIITRSAKDGERLTTLDGTQRTLTSSNVLVCDEKGPLSLAGVMGGEESEVYDASKEVLDAKGPERNVGDLQRGKASARGKSTSNILLEGAAWNFINIRKTAKQHNLPSEASFRFSRGVHPALAEQGVRRGLQLMAAWSGGKVAPGLVDEYPLQPNDPTVTVSPKDVRRLIGIELTAQEIADLLAHLEFESTVDAEHDYVQVKTPPHRLDIGEGIVGIADVIEEVARSYGYDRIPETRMADALPPQIGNPVYEWEERARDVLVDLGLQEVVSYRLTSPERESRLITYDDYVTIANPITPERRVLRRSVLASILESAEKNARAESIAMFEIGSIFEPIKNDLPNEPHRLGIVMTGLRHATAWDVKESPVLDFYDLKGRIELLLGELHYPNVSYTPTDSVNYLHPGKAAEVKVNGQIIGVLGELHPLTKEKYEFGSAPVIVAEFDLDTLRSMSPTYGITPVADVPPVFEDIAVIVDESVPAERVASLIKQTGGKTVTRVHLFDVYRDEKIGSGKKSLAYNLTYQSDKTMTDAEAAAIRTKIVKRLEHEVGAKLRS